ncbi:MAG: RNA 2'-phosphotransferase [Cytophagales bacterium]|nr:RNA 2'-phosphotransferase [Cytophagales bacterium]
MNEKRISKLLSYTLRHHPEGLFLKLDPQGWVEVKTLLNNLRIYKNINLDLDRLAKIVKNNDKQRFSLSDDLLKIRANQGHSIDIDLGYTAQTPPPFLYHGTASKYLENIEKKGILKQNRHHVHLSSDYETAHKVGSRHGIPVILKVKSLEMHNDGILFYQSKNGVWLTDIVEPKYFEKSE